MTTDFPESPAGRPAPAAAPRELWELVAARAGMSLTPEQEDRLFAYLDLLAQANEVMNLTRITDRAEAELLHVADPLTLLPFLPRGAFRLADVGSGGGVPGIPLAIVRPDATIMLIESTKKKAAFLEATVKTLGLKNVSVSSWRAEKVARSNSRETFDVVVARAVAIMESLAEWCIPLVRIGGTFLAMKGPRVVDELPGAQKSIRDLGGKKPTIHPVELPGVNGHVVVEVKKERKTPGRYPHGW